MTIKDVRTEFTIDPTLSVSNDVLRSHNVWKGRINGSSKIWILKEINDPYKAKIELFAQEFNRLVSPHQPETRLMRDASNNVHFILSEESRDYQPIPENSAESFNNGRYTGLGQVLICAMFLQEIDLKNGNVGIDHLNRVIKIDGDRSLISLQSKKTYASKSYKQTPKAIANLPENVDFYSFNWLNFVRMEKVQTSNTLVDPRLRERPHFQQEINEAMLKIVLLPDYLISHFADIIFPADSTRFIEFFKSRRDELLESAFSNTLFLNYLSSNTAYRDFQDLMDNVCQFTINGDDSLVVDEVGSEYASTSIREQYEHLMSKLRLTGHASLNHIQNVFSLESKKEPKLTDIDSWPLLNEESKAELQLTDIDSWSLFNRVSKEHENKTQRKQLTFLENIGLNSGDFSALPFSEKEELRDLDVKPINQQTLKEFEFDSKPENTHSLFGNSQPLQKANEEIVFKPIILDVNLLLSDPKPQQPSGNECFFYMGEEKASPNMASELLTAFATSTQKTGFSFTSGFASNNLKLFSSVPDSLITLDKGIKRVRYDENDVEPVAKKMTV